jgi:iron only hydrogenase large subunit-like protein
VWSAWWKKRGEIELSKKVKNILSSQSYVSLLYKFMIDNACYVACKNGLPYISENSI